MSSTTTIASYELACSRDHREVPGGYDFAALAFASSYVTGRGWALIGSQEV